MTPAMKAATDLGEMLRAIVILSPTELIFAGEHTAVPPEAAGQMPGMAPDPQLAMIAVIQASLYQHCYNRRFDGKPAPMPGMSSLHEITPELSQANAGRERWDAGWQVYQAAPNGVVHAQKQNRAHMFTPGQYLGLDGTPGVPRQGAVVNVLLSKEARNWQPGFYLAFSETVPDQQDQLAFLRFYFNVSAEGAPELVRAVSERFNRFQLPYRLKCLTHRELYQRSDSAVLFIPRRHFQFGARLIRELYPRVEKHLRADVPLFTKRLAGGLSLAEDPGTGDSFGASRCRLLAEGVWAAYLRGLQTEPARLEEIRAVFGRVGINLAAPWLSPGSIDNYEFPPAD
jgi:hypothetical protein